MNERTVEPVEWKVVTAAQWPWRYFSPEEMACPHCRLVFMQPQFMDKLDALRGLLGAAVTVASAFRCPEHNAAVGGSDNSAHLRGWAIDPQDPGGGPRRKALLDGIYRVGFRGFGMGARQLHIDDDPGLGARAWFYG